MQKFFIPFRFIAQQQQTFGIGVQAAQWVNLFWKIEYRERLISRSVIGELRNDAVRLVEGNDHAGLLAKDGSTAQDKFLNVQKLGRDRIFLICPNRPQLSPENL